MPIHRLVRSFTAGEISPLMYDRADFDRFKNGCLVLKNMVCATQGPAIRRPGFRFIYSLNALGLDTSNPIVRTIPFIFNELQAYTLIFFMHTDGDPRVVFATGDGLVVYGDPPPTECPSGTPIADPPDAGDIVTLVLPTDFDIEAFDWAQSADEMYIAQTGLQPHIIKRYDHTCWVLTAVTFTDQPSDWSDTNGWPERVIFHQQRIAFAANLLRRQTVWTSKAGDFSDFGVSSPLLDSDAVTFTLDSGTQNKIVWMASGKSLYIGTIGNEWTVTGNSQTSLTPSSILAQRQTNNGSEPRRPLLVGLTTLFVEKHGRTVNEFVYDYTYDSYKTSDMTVLAPHLTELYSIVDWAYQQTPHGVIWAVREDGKLLGLTYQRQHKVVGWHRHDTQGAFLTSCTIPGDTREDELWVVVKRIIDGADKYYIEKLGSWDMVEEAEWGRFLDSHSIYLGPAVSTITGLDHLEGEEVHVLADGGVHPPVTVEAGGIVSLNNSYTHVVVGLPYTSEIRPTRPEAGLDDGTSFGRMSKITALHVDLYRSLGMVVGSQSEEGEKLEEVPFRKPWDATGAAVPLFSGWKRWRYFMGYDRDVEYFIRQEKPLPLIVRAVMDIVEVYE